MAERLAPGDYDQLHHFVSAGVWDAAPLETELLIQADRLVGGGDAVLVIDDTAVPKKGMHSVGVAAQYASVLGKTANCQTLVSLTLARGEVPVMVALRLFSSRGLDERSGTIKASWCPGRISNCADKKGGTSHATCIEQHERTHSLPVQGGESHSGYSRVAEFLPKRRYLLVAQHSLPADCCVALDTTARIARQYLLASGPREDGRRRCKDLIGQNGCSDLAKHGADVSASDCTGV